MMEVKIKAKKGAPPVKPLSLPLATPVELTAVFNGLHVVVSDPEAIHLIYEKGNFGKGTLSRGAPVYHKKKDDIPRIIWEQQYRNEIKWGPKHGCPQTPIDNFPDRNYQLSQDSVAKFLQSALSSDETVSWNKTKETTEPSVLTTRPEVSKYTIGFLESNEEASFAVDEPFRKIVNDILESKKAKVTTLQKDFNEEVIVICPQPQLNANDQSVDNISAELKIRKFPVKESLNLNFEEAFFLNFALQCLKVTDGNNVVFSSNELWKKFCSIQQNFCEKYLVYHYYRSKGWIVHSGLKYGGDYLLYKDGPAYNHATFLVKIVSEGTNFIWRDFLAINRLVETFNKEVIFCTVLHVETKPVAEHRSLGDFLRCFRVQEVTSKRWFPTKDRVEADET
ncbi:hypothetical protein RUM43_009784 [Polyplax serrata]|uniref:tRNA-splicing endonuclease subunit Sen2 n=1 Tax=Polyplax serrata TaxID=468196 RepID=A0AAN8RZW2_POLSC